MCGNFIGIGSVSCAESRLIAFLEIFEFNRYCVKLRNCNRVRRETANLLEQIDNLRQRKVQNKLSIERTASRKDAWQKIGISINPQLHHLNERLLLWLSSKCCLNWAL